MTGERPRSAVLEGGDTSPGARRVPPPARVRWQLGDLTCWCLPEFESALRALYVDSLWVYDALQGQPGADVLPGRRPVVGGHLGTEGVVVKRLHHGGLMAQLTGDRFLSPVRFLANLRTADDLAAAGIATPRVLFVSWRRLSGWVRGEIGSTRIRPSRDAGDVLFGGAGLPAGWEVVVDGVAAMVSRLHAAGFVHQDLNLRNFLTSGAGEVLILDLDKVRRGRPPLARAVRRRNLARLVRSVRKLGRRADAGAVEAVVARLVGTWECGGA